MSPAALLSDLQCLCDEAWHTQISVPWLLLFYWTHSLLGHLLHLENTVHYVYQLILRFKHHTLEIYFYLFSFLSFLVLLDAYHGDFWITLNTFISEHNYSPESPYLLCLPQAVPASTLLPRASNSFPCFPCITITFVAEPASPSQASVLQSVSCPGLVPVTFVTGHHDAYCKNKSPVDKPFRLFTFSLLTPYQP